MEILLLRCSYSEPTLWPLPLSRLIIQFFSVGHLLDAIVHRKMMFISGENRKSLEVLLGNLKAIMMKNPRPSCCSGEKNWIAPGLTENCSLPNFVVSRIFALGARRKRIRVVIQSDKLAALFALIDALSGFLTSFIHRYFLLSLFS